jgi:hypothetical protein
MELFDPQGTGGDEWSRVDRVVEAIDSRFGRGAIRRASLAGGEPD